MTAVTQRYRLEVSHFAVAVVSFAIAAVMALLQALSRADVDVPFRSEYWYYLSVTAHGVLMSLVFTTFFIIGMGYLAVRRCLGKVEWEDFAWASFWIAVVGTAMAAVSILLGKATVLYTFYPPLMAHWSFYIGATLLVVGSWGYCAVFIRSFLVWRRTNPTTPVPLPVHGMMATGIIWVLATAGLAVEVVGMLVPWSLGLIDKVDPLIAKTWFWWFGHPLTYFWLVPAYVIWYTIAPRDRRRSAVQRQADAPRLRALHPVLDAGRLPPPVHGPGHRRRLEAAAHHHHLRHPLPEPGHGLHGHRLVRGRRAPQGGRVAGSIGSARCPGATRSLRASPSP